ncbi:MAG: twin-arginine translocase TatA/TatE family subunit [Legionellales bacterium]|nr:twin-arginine translocase TatA/TatE family subunit [Legionellales bacterium]|tara:strand:+ start:287 stop:451 length:165 start_codon:yes stop_codon:yes gene_type:complete
MNFAGISPGSLLLIFLIAVLLFGSKRLGSLGQDLGRAIKGFKQGMKEIDTDKTS